MRSDALAATRRDFLEASLAGGAIAIAGGSLPASAAERDDKSPKPTIAAYTGAMSVVQGQSLPFHVSTSVSRYKATITRVGLEPTVAWKSDAIAGAKHPVPKDASTRGCQWPVAFQVPIGSDWRSGVYLATLAGDGATTQTFFIVRSATPGTRARILFQLATNTYQAYNNWGGSSLYTAPGTSPSSAGRSGPATNSTTARTSTSNSIPTPSPATGSWSPSATMNTGRRACGTTSRRSSATAATSPF
jgi:hypothetical protein